MLISTLQVKQAMTLDVVGLKVILRESGYGANDIFGSCFLGMNVSGQFVYSIAYNEGDGVQSVGKSFVFFRIEDGFMVMRADF